MSHRLSLDDVRETLAQTPRIVEALVAAAPRDAFGWRETPQAWTPLEVLMHLADGETTNRMPRVERVLSGGGPFTTFGRDGGQERYRGWSPDALVGEFGQRRRGNLETL